LTYTCAEPSDIVSLLIGEDKRRGVAFVSVDTEEGLQPIGTAFFLKVPTGGTTWAIYATTARHCIEGYEETTIEFTDSSGRYRTIPIKFKQWFRSETTDVACCRVTWDDPMVRSLNIDEHLVTVHDTGQWSCGHEVYIVGLFVKHPRFTVGERDEVWKIEPIVRFGRIALPLTQVSVCLVPGNRGTPCKKEVSTPARLIESISFAGESGAPVFVYEAHTKSRARELYDTGQPHRSEVRDNEIPNRLLGLISSTWEIESKILSPKRHKNVGSVGLNSGIAVVIRAEDIREFLMTDEKILKDREKLPRSANTPPTPLSVDLRESEKPFTKDDFEAALKKVSRKLGTPKP
jgi:hypothetical protein